MRILSSLFFVLLFLTGCTKITDMIDDLRSSTCDFNKASITKVPSHCMKDYVVETYRLKPDKRFLLALAEIETFFTGNKKNLPSLSFENSEWHIQYGTENIGDLPEVPDFSDFKKVLIQRARTLNQKYPLNISSQGDPAQVALVHEINQVLSDPLIRALRKLNVNWTTGEHYQEDLALASRALVLLTLEKLDSVGVSDPLDSKAWAILSIAQAVTPSPMDREETLLADNLGYTAHATLSAKNLSLEDPIRLYVLNQEKDLYALAEAHPDLAEAAYLSLWKKSREGNIEDWLDWVNKFFYDEKLSPPVILTGLYLHNFEAKQGIEKLLPQLILGQMYLNRSSIEEAPFDQKPASNPQKILSLNQLKEAILIFINSKGARMESLFDQIAGAEGKKESGPFWDVQTYDAFYKGYFYSSLYHIGQNYLVSLSSQEAASQFYSELEKYSSEVAKDFKQWYGNLVLFKEGKGNLDLLIKDIQTLPNFGVTPLIDTFEVINKAKSWGSPKITPAIKVLSRRMDSRVSHRLEMADLAFAGLHDLNMTERLHKSIAEATFPNNINYQSWFASWSGNQERMIELLHLENTLPREKLVVLNYLVKSKGLSINEIQSEFEKLISENPSDWDIHADYINYLENEMKDYEKGRKTANHWLENEKAPENNFNTIFAQTAIARMFYKEGRYEEGLIAIKPAAESWQAGAMERAALLLDKLEKHDDAERLMGMALERYPDIVRTRSLMAEMFWRHGKNREAARTLKESPNPITSADWLLTVSDHFRDVFVKEPMQKGIAAVAIMAQSGISPWNLKNLPPHLSQAGNNELAFKISSMLTVDGMGDLEFTTDSYHYMKEWKGKEAGLKVIRENIPAEWVNPASMIFFQDKEYDLILDFNQNPQGSGADYVWLMKAAAFLKSGKKPESYQKELLQYYSTHKSSYYDHIGEYLLGLKNENEIIAMAHSPKQRCEITFFIGVKAESQGDFRNASDWYRASVETGLVNNGEYRWAFNQLYEWYASGKTLTRISNEAKNEMIASK